ncbi:serine/threonine-protein kinase [Kribbella soli]|uniref:non-specific serine/threonine protein kinase n=1 Tax=Kribbella soli TaxID=1124743 RepID=A0A4R0H387_9ACTN|nr:serine/threonine-protein kinase [Kribbella soli]TCC03654.1 serine/threonine protein kinase [Kribbella soli]
MPDVFAGRFELIDPIGVGGAGTVWRAWDRRQERLCAAKVLRQRDAGALLRFVREQGRRLDHPNVLSPYGWAADDDMALLAMDLVGGGSVDNLVADFGPLPPRLAAELLGQLLGALDKIHTAGVLHRDVKPANLLLETTGTARPMLRLSDFGIAIALGEPRLTVHGTVVGTPGYLAPEVLAGAAPSPRQDLYAAGVTAWQLLTGAEPPERGSLPTRPPDATDPIWNVVAALTQPDPTTRPESAAEALAALAPSLAEPLAVPAHTPDGELIEVFDHLPQLPATSPTPTLQDAAPASPEDEGHTPAQEHPPHDAQANHPPAREASQRGEVRRAGGRVGRRTAVVVAVAVMVAVVGGGGAALLAVFDPFGDQPPPSGASPSPTGSSESSTSVSGPITRGPGTTGVTPATPATRSADPQIRAGQPCGWQAAGSVETAADGTRVECRQQGSSYLWVKVS